MQITPTHYYGSAPFSAEILAGKSASIQVTVDGAESGPCLASIDPPVESAAFTISAHVDSYGVVLVVIKNESGETLVMNGTVNVVCIEVVPAMPHD